jgi:hypothetical protein
MDFMEVMEQELYHGLVLLIMRLIIVHLPEFTEVGVRFCKPGKSQNHSAKHDTEDSGTFAISQPTVNRRIDTYTGSRTQ